MTPVFSTDILIIGGGIAGLWLAARLRNAGYATILLESDTLGSAQTMRSQGIIHGGAKYTLHGALSGASEAIAAMPQRWRACLQGKGELDLSGTATLSDSHYLWAPAGFTGKVMGFFASKAVRGRVDSVAQEEYPPALQNAAFRGKAYRLNELVLDVPSLLRRMADLVGDSLLQARSIIPVKKNGAIIEVQTEHGTIQAQRIVLTAGSGNAELLQGFGCDQPVMQLRPLHMVMVKSPHILPLYAHCLGASPKPRLTVTTHRHRNGQWVWYLGGELAEADGVARNESAQIDFARQELNALLPWIDLSQAHWATLRVNRAEPRQAGLGRPDSAFLYTQGTLITGWPTKLALAPDFADRVLRCLQEQYVQPQQLEPLPVGLPRPELASPVWDQVFQ